MKTNRFNRPSNSKIDEGRIETQTKSLEAKEFTEFLDLMREITQDLFLSIKPSTDTPQSLKRRWPDYREISNIIKYELEDERGKVVPFEISEIYEIFSRASLETAFAQISKMQKKHKRIDPFEAYDRTWESIIESVDQAKKMLKAGTAATPSTAFERAFA